MKGDKMAYQKSDKYDRADHECTAKEVHDEMREDEVDIGGEEKSTEEWMRPQTGEEVEG
jgi:hypothetical protein